MKKDHLTCDADVRDGKLEYLDPEFRKKFDGFKRGNEGKKIKITYEAMDAVEYFQHKYLNGFVIPQIAMAQGELDIGYITETLKEKFLKQSYENIRDIPGRHRSRCRIMMFEKVTVEGEIISEKYYIPSRATLNYNEMKDFILKCEGVRDGLIDWAMFEKEKEKVRAMLEARALAFSKESEQGKLFEVQDGR